MIDTEELIEQVSDLLNELGSANFDHCHYSYLIESIAYKIGTKVPQKAYEIRGYR